MQILDNLTNDDWARLDASVGASRAIRDALDAERSARVTAGLRLAREMSRAKRSQQNKRALARLLRIATRSSSGAFSIISSKTSSTGLNHKEVG